MLKHSKVTAILCSALFCLGTLPLPAAAANCQDIEIIFARGSGAAPNVSADYLAFKSALQQELKASAPTLSYHFYDLGSQTQSGHQYPAVSVENAKVLLGTYIGSGQAFAFGNSVEEGIAELQAYISNTSKTCHNTEYVLAGYSQGAMLISQALPTLPAEKILYAATFGDPKLYLPEGKAFGRTDKPLACSGKNLSNYRIDVPDCEVESGILGALNPYQTSAYLDKLGAWCNEADFMCGSYFDFSGLRESISYEGRSNPLAGLLKAHLSYKTDDSYNAAAKLFLQAIARAHPTQLTPTTSTSPTQNLALLLDVTGSMASLLSQYRTEALKLAQQVQASGGRVALYTYGDELASDPDTPQSPQLLCDYTCSLTEIEAQLNLIQPSGGGDEPESALSALLHVMNTMSWQRGANKSIVLLTDASYHSTDVRGITLNDVIKRSYEIDPVNIFTLTPSSMLSTYADLTSQTGGQAYDISSDLKRSTTEILSRPYVNIGEVHYSDTPSATISNATVTYSGKAAQIALQSANATAFYLTLGGNPLGLTLDSTFTLADLPLSSSQLSITPINSDGRRGSPTTISLTPPQASSSPVTPPLKAPNTGAH